MEAIYQKIEKEDIAYLHFTDQIELEQDSDIIDKLEKATKLGNLYHSKVIIYFKFI